MPSTSACEIQKSNGKGKNWFFNVTTYVYLEVIKKLMSDQAKGLLQTMHNSTAQIKNLLDTIKQL